MAASMCGKFGPLTRLVALILLAGAQAGCGFLAGASEKVTGKDMAAKYSDLKDKSMAIVIYVDDATSFEYPSAREELSSFLTAQFRQEMPKVKLLNYKDVLEFQNDTLNWQSLPVKDIGKHFGVERVLYIELLEYSSRDPGSSDLLRGRIKANLEIFESGTPGDQPAWKHTTESIWPKDGPLDVLQSNDNVVRQRALTDFSETLVKYFYDHVDFDKPIHDR